AVASCGNAPQRLSPGRAELMLSDPKVPSTLRPFHAMARFAPEKALPMVRRDEKLVREATSKSMSSFIASLRKAKVYPGCAAIVSDDEPAQIGNPHFKAHPHERCLFREAAASAAREHGIESLFLVKTEVDKSAGKIIGIASGTMNRWLADIAVAAGRPWRTDEKTAAVAARIALSHQ